MMLEDTIGIKKSTAYNRVQTYRRLCHGLSWSEEMAFALHLWSPDTPRVLLDQLGKWLRDGTLKAVNCPHRLPGVDRERIAMILGSVGFLEKPLEATDQDLDLAMEMAIELMGGKEDDGGLIEEAIQDLNELTKEALSQEIAALTELRPQDARERIEEDLLGGGHLEFFLYYDRMDAVNLGLSFFQKEVGPDGLEYERGRTDRVVNLGKLPSWVEIQLRKRIRTGGIAAKPPERFISKEDALIGLLNKLGDVAAGDTLYERVENVIRHYATQTGRIAGGE